MESTAAPSRTQRESQMSRLVTLSNRLFREAIKNFERGTHFQSRNGGEERGISISNSVKYLTQVVTALR